MSDPYIKVTRINNKWGVRCFAPDNTIFMEELVDSRLKIGPTARSFLRIWDKLGGSSRYADKARHRIGIKESIRKLNGKKEDSKS